MTEYKKIIQKVKPEMEEVLTYFTGELKKVRADRATPSLIEDIMVDCFDQKLPLKQLAAISCPERRQLLIQPWDKNYVKDIIAAIQKAESQLSPVVEENAIRITLPPLTEEYRQSLLKTLSGKKEDARVRLKKIREDAWREIQDKVHAGEVTEDEKYRAKDELQKIIDEYNRKVDEMIEKREKEIKE